MGMIRSFEDLTVKGFDVQEGIRLCGDDEEIYMEVLWAAMEEGKELLREYLRHASARGLEEEAAREKLAELE